MQAEARKRKAVFLGDLVDRGPKVVPTLRLVMSMVRQGHALCLPGNHDVKLLRKLRGKDVKITHGLDQTLRELEGEPKEFHVEVEKFIDSLVSHYVLDDGRLVVAHAGMKEQYIGRASGRVREFALYGETTGETDEFGLPVRYNWAAEYRGNAAVVYGHTPVPEADWLNRTINIDTGCVFGGKLTALRWPEREVVSVAAKQTYAEPAKPFRPIEQGAPELSAQRSHDDVLDIDDVLGKRIINTRLHHSVTVREENAIAALEVMSRFAANPKWLIYLPPTMSPPATSDLARQPHDPLMLRKTLRSWPVLVAAGLLAFALVYLRWQGRVWWCECGRWTPVSLNVNSMHNSQHLFDAYSLSHVLHGLVFFGLLWLLRGRVSFGWRFALATAVEIGWEIMENSPIIINRYRTATIALGYTGDSILNSLGDIASFLIGFWIAKKVGLWWSMAIFVVVEVTMLWWMRDNLMLNVLMLLWPIDAIRQWQAGG